MACRSILVDKGNFNVPEPLNLADVGIQSSDGGKTTVFENRSDTVTVAGYASIIR